MKNKYFMFCLDVSEVSIIAPDILTAINKFRQIYGDELLKRVSKII